MLHAEDAGVTLAVDVAEDVPVVQLAGGGLLAARVVALLEVADLVPRAVDVGDDVPLRDLLVVHVEEDLAGGAPDRAADLEGLGDLREEKAGVVLHGFRGSSTITRPAGSRTSARRFRLSMTLAV